MSLQLSYPYVEPRVQLANVRQNIGGGGGGGGGGRGEGGMDFHERVWKKHRDIFKNKKSQHG